MTSGWRVRWLAAALMASAGWAARAGETVCPVKADNSLASHSSEETDNDGKSARLKIKGRENMPVFTFDFSGIPAGAVVAKAVLSVKVTDSKFQLRQIGYSTLPTEWVEGDNKAGEANSCFKWPGGAGKRWGDASSIILDVMFGNGGNVTGCTIARRVGDRYEIDLPARVVEAMRRDQPGGLMIMDETGWWPGELSNIYIRSRETGADGPILTVTWGERRGDKSAPSAPALAALSDTLGDGQILLEIICGGNNGSTGTALGYDVCVLPTERMTAANWSRAQALPRHRIPRPKAAGEKLRLWLKDLEPGKPVSVGIVAYDELGNCSPVAATVPVIASGPSAKPDLGVVAAPAPAAGGPVKAGESMQLWAVGELTKIDPVSGRTLGGGGYVDSAARAGNEVWAGGCVALQAVRGEIVAFRVAVENAGAAPLKGVTVKPGDLKRAAGGSVPAAGALVRRDWYAKGGGGWYVNVMPEAGEKDGGRFSVPAEDQSIAGQKLQTVLVEYLVPKDAAPGVYEGAVAVASEAGAGDVPVRLEVAGATMPDRLSFIIELNAYGARDRETAHAVHRLAHRLRLGYNVVPYGHAGNTSVPFVPRIAGAGAAAHVESWEPWDAWMGPLLDGSLFKDLPRGATPIPHCYLPFFESYPVPTSTDYLDGRVYRKNYTKVTGKPFDEKAYMSWMCANDVLVEDGFSDAWKQATAAVAGEYRRHFEAKGWTKTEFQIFANNKHFKGDSSLWTLDEPSFGRDFRALGFLYRTFKAPFTGSALEVISRGDVSRPEWQGDRLDGACDVSVVSSAIYSWQRLVQRRRLEHGERYWFYGGGGGADRDLSQIVAVYIKNWCGGCDGGLAYWTSFQGGSWDSMETLACVLGASHGYTSKATATDRLVAQRRAQQDIELLNLLAAKPGWSRTRVSRAVSAAIDLSSKTQASGADDPGSTSFGGISAANLEAVRRAVIRLLSEG